MMKSATFPKRSGAAMQGFETCAFAFSGIICISVGKQIRVCYHLCIRHTLDMVFALHQSSENAHCYFHIIKKKKTYG